MWNRAEDTEESFRNRAIWGSAAVVAIVAIAAGAYFRYFSAPSAAPPPVKSEPQAAAAAAPTEPVKHPLPEAATSAPLPALNESDQTVRDSFVGLLGAKPVEQFLVPENLVRHLVATVDNLPRRKLAPELRPIKRTPGETRVAAQGESLTLSTENFARYQPFVRLVQSADANNVAAVYLRLYPLLQQAYQDLGYPDKYFNDRVIEAIDDLLATPETSAALQLTQPKVFYEFADPELEARSAGQKLLLRMGPANAQIVKGKLRELKAALLRQ